MLILHSPSCSRDVTSPPHERVATNLNLLLQLSSANRPRAGVFSGIIRHAARPVKNASFGCGASWHFLPTRIRWGLNAGGAWSCLALAEPQAGMRELPGRGRV